MWIVDGLPLHPLVVHAPVVLVPLAVPGVALYLLVPRWRRALGVPLVALAVAAAVTAAAAVSSGEALGDALHRGPELDGHRALGERVRLLAIVLAGATVALALHERRPQRSERTVAGGAAALLALTVASVTAVALTGHTGAQLAWAEVAVAPAPAAAPSAAASSPSVPGPAPAPSRPGDGEPGVDVVLGEWALLASVPEAPPGPVVFRFRNAGTVTHALRIRTPGSGRDRLEWRSAEVAPGESGTLVADLADGAYELTCPIEDRSGEHDALGMQAGFAVRTGAPAPAPPPALPPSPASSTNVDMSAFTFAPAELHVAVGTEVVWTNRDPAPHTATGDGWDTGRLAGGASGAVRFDRAGRFDYLCRIHPAMTGTVVVG